MYKIGDKVRIISTSPKIKQYADGLVWNNYMDKLKGKEFRIVDIDARGYYVLGEPYSWFWHPDWIECIVKNKKEDKQMRPTGFKEAAKIIMGGRPYYYALYGSAGVKKGDKVLVTGTANGRIHTVEDVVSAETALLETEQPLCAEVICKVDTSAYDARVKQREQKTKLRKLMEATVAQMDEVDKFKVYADHNPEMAKLLAQYNEINV